MSFCHERVNMAGRYIVVPGLGNTIGSMTMPVLGTYMVYGSHPENFLHSQVALALTNIGKHIFFEFVRSPSCYLFTNWITKIVVRM